MARPSDTASALAPSDSPAGQEAPSRQQPEAPPAPPVAAAASAAAGQTDAISQGAADIDLSRPPVAELDRQGTRIGKYILSHVLGKGGMGTVYEAVHEEISQRVAVKILSQRLAQSSSFRQRFLREAQVSSMVRDPGLVTVFDYGVLSDGAPYIMMERVNGRPLRAFMDELPGRQMSLRQVFRLGSQLAAALQVAHDADIVHRDIKPENIMLISDAQSEDLRIKILDFGIAKFMSRQPAGDTGTRAPLGTPLYMSPEQCKGIPFLTGKTDVYSLGVLLFEMLLGRPPFVPDTDDPNAVVRRHVFDTPRPLRPVRPDVPKACEELVLRMLHKSPAERPDMREVARALKSFAAERRAAPGLSFAVLSGMVLLLLVLIPLLMQSYYYYQHLELWSPGRLPQRARIAGTRFVIGSTVDEIDAVTTEIKAMGGGMNAALFLRETPDRRVTVADFYIDTHEVTNQSYAIWLNSLKNLTVDNQRLVYQKNVLLLDLYSSSQSGIHYDRGRFIVDGDRLHRPVVQVTWAGAQRYCEQQKSRLPTEAEWELAARGREGRLFPWGESRPVCQSAVFDWQSVPGLRCGSPRTGPAAVASTPTDRTPDGVYDLGGNVAEWTLDFYRERYPRCVGDTCKNPAVLENSPARDERDRRVVRGGSWFREFDALRGAGRGQLLADEVTGDVGFRCVRPTQ